MMKTLSLFLVVFSLIQSAFADEGQPPFNNEYDFPPTRTAKTVVDETPSIPRPEDYPADFKESDFNSKPWLKDFKVVAVVNKATTGREAQTIRVYVNGRAVRLHEVIAFAEQLNAKETDPEKFNERNLRIRELSRMIKNNDDTLFKVSTGRDAFEKKGVNHSQKDSWTVTPTGYYPMQHLTPRHKSESYSASGCDSAVAKFFGALFKKQFCTYMDFAMFFNRGIALHKAIPGTEGALGNKASGGCVRMPGALAEFVYLTIQATQVPNVTKIPVVNVDGSLVLDSNGNAQYTTMAPAFWGKRYAWSALVIVQNKVL